MNVQSTSFISGENVIDVQSSFNPDSKSAVLGISRLPARISYDSGNHMVFPN